MSPATDSILHITPTVQTCCCCQHLCIKYGFHDHGTLAFVVWDSHVKKILLPAEFMKHIQGAISNAKSARSRAESIITKSFLIVSYQT